MTRVADNAVGARPLAAKRLEVPPPACGRRSEGKERRT